MKKIFVILLVILTSCGARKVDVSKTTVKEKIDSSVVVKIDGTYVKENNVVVEECIDEIQYTPADTSKEMIVNGKVYFNTVIKQKKQRKKSVDKTKQTNKIYSVKKINVKKDAIQKTLKKKVDRKPNYFMYLWLLVPVIIIWVLEKYSSKIFPFIKYFK